MTIQNGTTIEITHDTSELVSLVSLVRAMWRASHYRGEVRGNRGIRDSAIEVATARGYSPVPVGDGDSKTHSPGTYRPVGGSCPVRCPYLGNGCYAQGGRVEMSQRRASAERDAGLSAAAAAMVWAALTARTARLHVSGDMGRDVDQGYVDGLCVIAREVRRLSGNDVVAWTYTHHEHGAWRDQLTAAGIVCRLSDHAGPEGAVVVRDRDHARELRSTGVKVAVCPAQLVEGVDCASCRLCWTRPDLTIAFLVHGQHESKARAAIAS